MIVVIAVLIHFVCESVPTAELKAIVLFGVTVMVAVPLCACEHVVELASTTLTNVYANEPDVPVGAATVTLFPLVVDTVKSLPPLILYVNVYGAVPAPPVKVTFGELPPIHTAVVPPMLAVGNGFTFTVQFAVAVCDVHALLLVTVIVKITE